MGFEKWLYRNGLGSPGHTSRSIVRWFHKYLATNSNFNDSDFYKDAYLSLYLERLSWQEKLRNKASLLNQFSDKIGYIIAENDMPLFIFAIESLETKNFRSGISNNNIDLVLDVIREEVEKLDNSLIRLGHKEYRNKAITFLNLVLDHINQN